MRTVQSFIRHKFTPLQALLIIVASVAMGFAANRIAVAASWSDGSVNALGVAAAAATFLPLQVVLYRRAHA